MVSILLFLSFFLSLFWMTRREQGYLRIAINVFFFQYHFCYHFKFILVRISTTPFLRLCHFFFFSYDGWYLGFAWGFVFIAFDVGLCMVSRKGKMLKGVEVDVEGKMEKEKMWKIIFTSSTTSIVQ